MGIMASVETPTTAGTPAPHAEIAYEQIKAAIISGALAPASRVSEQQLAEQLNVSRTPVHQAVVRLQNEEWLEVSSRRGITIAPLRADEMREIYEILIGLEGVAVASLASRESAANDEVDLELREACRRCELALEEKNLRRWAEEDDHFHRLLIERSGNSRLARVAASVMEHAHRARLLTVNLRPWPSASNEDHARILQEISNRDPLGARTALEEHRRRGISTLVPILEAYTPQTSFSFMPIQQR